MNNIISQPLIILIKSLSIKIILRNLILIVKIFFTLPQMSVLMLRVSCRLSVEKLIGPAPSSKLKAVFIHIYPNNSIVYLLNLVELINNLDTHTKSFE